MTAPGSRCPLPPDPSPTPNSLLWHGPSNSNSNQTVAVKVGLSQGAAPLHGDPSPDDGAGVRGVSASSDPQPGPSDVPDRGQPLQPWGPPAQGLRGGDLRPTESLLRAVLLPGADPGRVGAAPCEAPPDGAPGARRPPPSTETAVSDPQLLLRPRHPLRA